MAIFIQHRFLNRLLPSDSITNIRVLIIGTFNPGTPEVNLLTSSEIVEFHRIQTSRKFQKFSQVHNFYDRPQNRFWKVMDYIAHREFYKTQELRTVNQSGLKYYTKLKRETVYEMQSAFCRTSGLFITDVVEAIRPKSFSGIYENFQDTFIDKALPIWNAGIPAILSKYNPEKVIINFDYKSKSIPNISSKMQKLIDCYPNIRFMSLPSTSGAAGNNYEELCKIWGDELSCLTACAQQ